MKKFGEWVEKKSNIEESSGTPENYDALNYNIQNRVKGIRDDRSLYGQAAWEGLQSVYESLKKIAEQDPKRLAGIVQKIKSEIQRTDPAMARDMVAGMNRFINKAMGIQKQGEQA